MEQTIGKRIMKNRKRLGLTQDQLAEKLGVTAQAVSKWENDQSCPDISVIPQLADIFGITTDELLGRQPETQVHQGEVLEEEDCRTYDPNGSHFDFIWDPGKKSALCLALQVICVGSLYLASSLLSWDISFWSILWTTSLLIYGLFGLYPKFSFFRLGCALIGGYSLVVRLFPMIHIPSGSVVFAIAILLFGLSLLLDAFRKPKKSKCKVTYTDKFGKTHTGTRQHNYESTEKTFRFDGSFGSNQQQVILPIMEYGEINTSFGDFTVDLSGVQALAQDACLEADCNFGSLVILVPRKYQVKPDSSTSFGEFSVQGVPDSVPQGELRLDASVSFGEITVRYI